EGRPEGPAPPLEFTFPRLPDDDPLDRRERTRARAWHVGLQHDAALRQREPTGETLEEMLERSDAVESADEPSWGALQIWTGLYLARAGLVNALRGRPEAWGALFPTLFLSANWALVRSLHHEYASALVLTAAGVRAAFRGGHTAGAAGTGPVVEIVERP